MTADVTHGVTARKTLCRRTPTRVVSTMTRNTMPMIGASLMRPQRRARGQLDDLSRILG